MREAWVRVASSGGEAAQWYSPTLWHTMNASAWWSLLQAHSFQVRLGRVPLAIAVTLAAANNSLLGALQSLVFGARLRRASVQQDPVFVLGHWRSGTTHLHDLLALDNRFAFPSTYECAAPHHCLITGRIYPKLFSWLLPSKRLMDDMAIGFDKPQEDELALVALGAPSPLWSLAYPDESSGQAFMTLREVSDRERARWVRCLLEFLRLLAYRYPGKPLLLKSPPHTARLALLARMFPKARFVHIVRDPYTVFASTVHLWRQQQAVNALVQSNTSLESCVLQRGREMYDGFETARASLPTGRFHQLRYEDLVRDPLVMLQECYRTLELGDFTSVRQRVAGYLGSLHAYRANQYEISPAARRAVQDAWGPIYSRWEYEV